MSTLLICLATAVALRCGGGPAPSAPLDPSWPDRLVGHWEGEAGGRRTVEVWRKVDEHTYEGRGETWKGDRLVVVEVLRIQRFAGHWIYLACPDGKTVTSFQLEQQEDDTWVFTNLEHDFPQRIGYGFREGGGLHVWIEGPGKDGTPKRIASDLMRK